MLILLLQHPQYIPQVTKELDTAFADNAGRFTHASVQHLPMLNALLYETLRYRPVAALPLVRLSPDEGAIFCGHAIPGGVGSGDDRACQI